MGEACAGVGGRKKEKNGEKRWESVVYGVWVEKKNLWVFRLEENEEKLEEPRMGGPIGGIVRVEKGWEKMATLLGKCRVPTKGKKGEWRKKI